MNNILVILLISLFNVNIVFGQILDVNENTEEDPMTEIKDSYHGLFKGFTENMKDYNTFVRENCQKDAIIDCLSYMKDIGAINGQETKFLDIVYLVCAPFLDDISVYRDTFKPPLSRIENSRVLIHDTLTKLTSALTQLYSHADKDNIKTQKYIDFTLKLIALDGSIEQCLKIEKNLHW